MSIVFSHRPEAGISIAVQVSDGVAYLAAAFRNRSEPNFSRPLARQILRQRIETFSTGGHEAARRVKFVAAKHCSLTAQNIMYHLRQQFKPEHEEADAIFSREIVGEYGVDERSPLNRNKAWDLIMVFFYEAIRRAENEAVLKEN